MTARKKYPKEFKLDVVSLVLGKNTPNLGPRVV